MRRTYLDNTRWITVVLVVIYHVFYIFNGVTQHGIIGPFSQDQPQDVYMYIVYPWFMLLLFTIAGMSSRFYLDTHSDREYVRSRTRKLLVPSTIGLLVFGWATGYYNMAISGAFADMGQVPAVVLFFIMCLSGTGVLWFVQLLWLYSMILVLIRKVEKDRFYKLCEKAGWPHLAALTLLIWGSAQILNTPMVVVYRIGIYAAGFFIGYFVLSHDEVMDRLERYGIFFEAAALVSGILFVVMFWGANYAEHEVLDTFWCNLFAWSGTCGVLAFMKKHGGFENGFSKWMKKESWGLYVFHYLFIAMTGWYLHLHAPQMNPALVYILVACAAFAGAIVLSEIISRIPVIRWCVLGIGKEGNK